jgi:glycosyltransferase involved in cell wall biosynthesis
MRVVHVNLLRPRHRPGPEQLLAEWPTLPAVAAAAGRAGAKVSVVQSFWQDHACAVDGVDYHFIDEPAWPRRAVGAMPWRITSAVRALAPDVIHVNGLDFAWHTRMLCRLGVPVLVQDHASTPGLRRLRRQWGLAHVQYAAFTDEAQAAPFFASGALRSGTRIFSVPESSSDFRSGDVTAARAATGLHGDPAVLWVGRLDANKDPLTILDAIERAAADLPGLRLWCCYHEEALLPALHARLSASPVLAERVHLLGKVPHAQIEMLARAADFFMLGSRHEGSGYALIEAMACGATPIVSDIAPFRRLTGAGTSAAIGALAPVGDAAAFAGALVMLAARSRAELRTAAIAHFDTNLAFDRIGQQLRAIYETMIAGPRCG